VEGMPTTGIAPAFASVTRAFGISPESINKTPILTQYDRTAEPPARGLRKTRTASLSDVVPTLNDVPQKDIAS
jgi:hypothetical protein